MAFPPITVTAPPLTDWEFWFNGYTIGALQPAGILKVEGLGDMAQIRSGDPARSRQHGEFVGLDLYGGRDVTISVWARSDGVSLQDTLANIAAATVVGLTTEQPLWFQIPTMPPLAVMCRPRKRAVPWDTVYANAMVGKPVMQFHCTDPAVYAQAQSATVGLG